MGIIMFALKIIAMLVIIAFIIFVLRIIVTLIITAIIVHLNHINDSYNNDVSKKGNDK